MWVPGGELGMFREEEATNEPFGFRVFETTTEKDRECFGGTVYTFVNMNSYTN